MKRAALLIYFLAACLLLYAFQLATHYIAPSAGKNQTMRAELESFSIGPVNLYNIAIESQLALDPLMPADLTTLLMQKPRNVKIKNIDVTYADGNVALQDVELEFIDAREKGIWRGRWRCDSVVAEKLPYLVPEMKGSGEFTASHDTITLNGRLNDAGDKHAISFATALDPAAPDKTRIELTAGHMPFEGGMIRLSKGTVALEGEPMFEGVLQLENILLAVLLNDLMEGNVSATGSVAGTLPVSVRQDGTLVFDKAVLAAAQGGSIVLRPGAIPKSNEQLALVSDVLGNFWYDTLQMHISSDDKQELSASMHLQGHNPDMYGGRKIKLNVHLRGDLVSLVKHSVFTLTDPKSILQKGKHEER
ncbi:MAG: YdbH domain-containing protein [Alphaproteobacteria bacterium]